MKKSLKFNPSTNSGLTLSPSVVSRSGRPNRKAERVKIQSSPRNCKAISGTKSWKFSEFLRAKCIRINTENLHYKILNEKIHKIIEEGYKKIVLDNICGQRYLGDGIKDDKLEIIINGTPGNDLAAFMDGPKIIVNGNAQDGTGNTMNSGEVIIYGDAGDIVGHSMRGGRIFVKGDVGYRVGIHMKAYQEMFPVIIVGGSAKDFLGEYMAGGLLVVLGLNLKQNEEIVGDFIGTGMHGGNIFIRSRVDERCLGKEVKITHPSNKDMEILTKYLNDFCKIFHLEVRNILSQPFIKLYPYSHRPYGRLYAY